MAAEPPTASWALADEVLGHGVGDGRRQRVRLAHLVHGAGHERPKLCLGSGAAGRAKRLQVR